MASSVEWFERVRQVAQGEGAPPNLLWSPLMSPTMRCIEMVAAAVRGDHVPIHVPIDVPESLLNLLNSHQPKQGAEGGEAAVDVLPSDHYLCSGLDLYLQREPDVMSCMALVHSRIRRVYYKDSCAVGALGTHTHMHDMRQLNHRYRVFLVDSAGAGAGTGAGAGAAAEHAAMKRE